MAKETNVEKLCDRELLEKILSIVERQEKLPPPAHEGGHRLYDNKSLMEKLNIKEKYLKKLRDNGYLGYSREGDKYHISLPLLCKHQTSHFHPHHIFHPLLRI